MIFGVDLAKLIEALAEFLWPLMTGYLLFSFRGSIESLIRSATSRKFTLKVGGNELTMDEITEQQRVLISDMQSEIGELKKELSKFSTGNNLSKLKDKTYHSVKDRVSRILWVDDQPKNNSFLIANLESMGVSVKTVESSKLAINAFRSGRYDTIISDIGRPESEKAGIELVQEIRKTDTNIPIHIYCGSWAAKNLKNEALNAGANSITSSGTVLLNSLNIGVHG